MLEDYFYYWKSRETLLLSLKFQCFLLYYCNEKYYTRRNYVKKTSSIKKKRYIIAMQNGVFRTERRKIKILFKKYTLFLLLLILPVKYFMCKLGKWKEFYFKFYFWISNLMQRKKKKKNGVIVIFFHCNLIC